MKWTCVVPSVNVISSIIVTNKFPHFNNENESYGYIDDLLKDGDLVLFKGSHGMHLSNIIKYLVDNQK